MFALLHLAKLNVYMVAVLAAFVSSKGRFFGFVDLRPLLNPRRKVSESCNFAIFILIVRRWAVRSLRVKTLPKK